MYKIFVYCSVLQCQGGMSRVEKCFFAVFVFHFFAWNGGGAGGTS